MNKRSPLIHRLILVLSALVALGAAAWAGMRAFEPVPVPPVPASKPSVTFDPRADIRANPLFATLQAVVRGDIQIGALGRSNPFAAPGTGSAAPSSDEPSVRGSVQEIPLEGAQAVALAPATAGGVLVLVGGQTASGIPSYEIRHIVPDAAPATVGRWNAPSGGAEGHPLTPVALRQSGDGRVWLLSLGGSVGSLQSDGSVSWTSQAILPSLANIRLADWDGFIIDDIGRLWVADGDRAFVGNGTGFQAVDLTAQLSDEDLLAIASRQAASGIPADYPWRVQTLADGRVGIVTPSFGAIFALSLQGNAEITRVADTASALAFGPDGSLWSMQTGGTGLFRQFATTTRNYPDVRVLPKQVMAQPLLAAASRESLYALDYAPAGTVLWRTVGSDWVAQVIPPQGAQPQDQVERVLVDGQGNVWALLRQRGLLLVRPPKTP